MPSAAYDFILATAVEDLWQEKLVRETLDKKQKIVHILGVLLRHMRKEKRRKSTRVTTGK